MASKRFQPSLLNIIEEDSSYLVEPSYEFSRPSSRRGSAISLKRENSRRKSCSGCPGCEPQDFGSLCGRLQNCKLFYKYILLKMYPLFISVLSNF